MIDKNEKIKPIKFIRDICNGRTEEELNEAEQNFREYLLVVKEICDRIERDENRTSDFDESLTI